MFTGIIEELGVVQSLSKRGQVFDLAVSAAAVSQDARTGDSIAVNGVCLTVVGKSRDTLAFQVMEQTMATTALGCLARGQKVNLERSLKVGDRMSGHFVLGHIDCTGIIRKKIQRADTARFTIAVPGAYGRYILPKGSIAVDGISLTVAEKTADTFTVCIIPHTFRHTTLFFRSPSQKVNIECDILAKRDAGSHIM